MYTTDSRSLRQITLLLKARSTRHDAVKHDGQLVTRFYDNSYAHDDQGDNPGQENRGLDGVLYKL